MMKCPVFDKLKKLEGRIPDTTPPTSSAPMAHAGGNHKLLESSRVAPAAAPPNPSGATTVVPLTFFDICWAGPLTVKNLFFYHFPHSANHLIEVTLPNLKHSLSLTLQHFFPLAGNLVCPPPPNKPFIRFTPKEDTVALTVLESGADFKHLVANHPRGLQEFDHLVPELPLLPKSKSVDHGDVVDGHDDDDDDDGTLVFPLLSLQITVFPGEGLCIGATYRHVLDGRSFTHFIRSWASVCLNGGDLACVDKSMPFFGREVVRDPKGLEALFLGEYFKRLAFWKVILRAPPPGNNKNGEEDTVRLTLAFGAKDSDRLKQCVFSHFKNKNELPSTNLSKLMVTCALIWVSLIKSTRGSLDNEHKEEQEQEEWLMLQADCRNRLGYPLPSTYCGSCLAPVPAALKRKDLVAEQGFFSAIKVMDGAISRMKSDPLQGSEKWMTDMFEVVMSGRAVTVAGSPNFGVYETDFGFGRPNKVEMVTGLNCVAFAESGKEEGGIEVGVALRRSEVECLVSAFEQGLRALLSE